MDLNVKDKTPADIADLMTVEDWKMFIRETVAEAAKAHADLSRAIANPEPISKADKKLLGTERKDISTVDLAKARIAFWEDVQDRLWHWYRKINGGEARGAGTEG